MSSLCANLMSHFYHMNKSRHRQTACSAEQGPVCNCVEPQKPILLTESNFLEVLLHSNFSTWSWHWTFSVLRKALSLHSPRLFSRWLICDNKRTKKRNGKSRYLVHRAVQTTPTPIFHSRSIWLDLACMLFLVPMHRANQFLKLWSRGSIHLWSRAH